MTDKQDADRKPGLIRNEAAGFVEFVSEDVATITGPMEARNVEPILRMAEPRELLGYRVYDRTPDPELAKVTAERDEARRDFAALEHAIVGAAGLSAITVASELRAERDEARADNSDLLAAADADAFQMGVLTAELAESERTQKLMVKDWSDFCETMGVRFDTQEAVADELAARESASATAIEAAIEAMEPFASFADLVAASRPGWSHDAFCIVSGRDISLTMEPFHRAGAVLGGLCIWQTRWAGLACPR